MKMLLIGTPSKRRTLRLALENSPPVIVGEFNTFADARRAGIEAEAVVQSVAAGGDEEDGVVAEHLTGREIEVLELLAEGLPNKAIAERLGISDQTVKFHIGSIIGKLGAANRTDAVRRGVRRGLVAL
jgi:DNA-binding NarL/FixJ family response regulator